MITVPASFALRRSLERGIAHPFAKQTRRVPGWEPNRCAAALLVPGVPQFLRSLELWAPAWTCLALDFAHSLWV